MKRKIISVLLCIALIIGVSPITSAQNVTDSTITSAESSEIINQTSTEPYIISEIVEKRTENTKHFLMSDRSIMAAMYDETVHYDDNGTWVDINNNFSTNSENEFENKSNSFKTKFSKKSNGNKLVTIKKENYSLSWMLDNANKVNAEISQANETETEDISVLKNIQGTVTYPNIQNHVDLQYVVSGSDIKENIILYSAAAPTEYSFTYKFNKLKYLTNDNGQIEFYDESNPENVVFIIDAPYVYDSANSYSDAVEMNISETNNGFTLTLKPNAEWLLSQDRVYPIVIDPAILTKNDNDSIWDITLKENNPTDSNYQDMELLVGSDTSGNAYRTLMKFDELPEIGPGGIIINAKMVLNAFPEASSNNVLLQKPRPTDAIQVNIHRVNALWSEYGAAWNYHANDYDSIIEDYFIYNKTNNSFTADITNLVSEWYKTDTYNYGVMIKAANESAANHVMQFASSNFGDSSNSVHTSWRPVLMVNYRACIGLEDYWSYTTQSMGGYGTGYVNNYNGNLTYVHEDVSFNSIINGFTLSHVYNSANSQSSTGRYGVGWNLSLVQTVEPVSIEGNENVKYVYTDGDGTKHYFVELEDESIVDEDGLGYTYSPITEGELIHKITDKNDNVLKFDLWGALRRIIDPNGNTINLNYSPVANRFNYLCSITTSSGGEYILRYDSDYLLTSITDNAGRVTSFAYASDSVSEITYPDGTKLNLLYTTLSNEITPQTTLLNQITLPNGYQYRYDTDYKNRISTSFEMSSNGTQVNNLYYAYEKNQTTVSDSHNRQTTYQFDSFGRATGAYDNDGNSYSESYTSNSNTKERIFSNNKLSTTSNNIRYIDNLVLNPIFSDGLSSWSQYTDAPNTTSISVVGNQSYISSKSIKINSSSTGIHAINQTIYAGSKKTYTLSANIKTENVVSSLSQGAAVKVITSSSGGEKYYFSDFITGTTNSEINGGFVTSSLTVSLATDEKIIRIAVGLHGASGTVWVDSVQLEEGDTNNKINLVSNSDFESTSSLSVFSDGYTANFDIGTAGGPSFAGAHSDGYCFRISGSSTEKRYVYQTLNISGKAGDVYSVGGWAKADAVANHSTDGITDFKLTAGVRGTDGIIKEYPFDLNEYISDWQYVSGNFIAEKDYNQILIYCSYNYNANTAYFDDLFLYHDTAQSYTYDSNGNVISTSDNANQQSNFSYSDTSLSKTLNPDGTTYEYGYDSKNNLVTSRSNVGVQYDITYDENGNSTKTSILADNYSNTIQSGKTYYLRLKGTGKYLTTDGENACQSSFTGANNQKWLVEKAINGGYYLYPQSATTKVLNVANNTQDGAVTVATHTSADKQRFEILLQSDYSYRIIAKCSTDSKLITVPHADTQNNVAVWTPQGELNANQSWYFEDAAIEPVTQIEDGAVYQLRARHSGRYVAVRNGATSDGAYLVQYAQGYLDSQQFIIRKCGNTEYYTLSPLNAPEKYVNVTATDTGYNCKYIEIRDEQTSDTNKFKFTYDSQRQAYMISPKSNPDGECFAVAFSYCTDDASVVDAGVSDSDNRYFVLEKISNKITSSATFQNNGNYPHTVTDSRGNTTTYTYDTARGIQTGVTDALGNTTTYSYNSQNDRLNTVSSGNSTVRYYYNSVGQLIAIESPSTNRYNFIYDAFGNTSEIYTEQQILVKNEYNISRGLLTRSTYGNGQKIGYTYDTLDRVTQKLYNNVIKVKYRYDKFGNLYEKQDLFTNTTYRYNYDLTGRITGIVGSNNTSLNYVYDDYNRVKKYVANIGNNSNSTEYIYGDSAVAGQTDGLIYGVKQNGTQRISYAYDNLARLNTRTLNTTTPFTTYYYYHPGATTGTTTTLLKTLQNGNDTYEYSYDAIGNITQIKINNTVYESYTYDSLNQLKTVTRGSETYTYTYDRNGNIRSVAKNGAIIKNYGYHNINSCDLLTDYNGQTFTHDQIGNPLQYRDGFNFTWSNGRQLTGITKGNDTISYLYNADGLRASKIVNGTTTEYYWLDGVLLGQKTGNDYIIYLYDENGTAYGIICNNTYYYYVFNAQGDVVGIVNASGNVIARYDYDAWGNILSITNSSGTDISQNTSHIANINPIRYRGYYYDSETGLYYLQSRYYDPVTQRFLNADGLISTGQGILGTNMFAYCGNNPINLKDPSGQGWITALIITVVVSVVAAVVINSVMSKNSIDENYNNNSAKETATSINAVVHNQEDDSVSGLSIGVGNVEDNGCGAVAIHNAKILKGKDSTMSDTIKDVQNSGGLILAGTLGVNPFVIKNILKKSGIESTPVGLDELNQPGTYIIAYWNSEDIRYGAHFVTVEYDGNKYTPYNGPKGNPQVYAKNYIFGYRIN